MASRAGARVLLLSSSARLANRIPKRGFHESFVRRTTEDTHAAYRSCLDCNKKWAQTTASHDPDFFPNSAKGQSPQILWIGCSDSRVPETTVLEQKPGSVFVHRNIANVVSPGDVSLLSVVEFSVRYLKVRDIVVCGHTSCGGVNATLGNSSLGVLDIWLQPMRALREKHSEELEKLEPADKMTFLAKLNVQAGVEVIKRIPTVIEAMGERDLKVHGLLYNLHSGVLDELDEEVDKKKEELRAKTFELK